MQHNTSIANGTSRPVAPVLLDEARLYVLVDGRSAVDDLVALVRRLVEVGVHVLQLRDKRLKDRELLMRAQTLRSLTRGTRTLFIVNDRPDIATLADADGVHVGQDELSVDQVRRIVGEDRLVGVSTHGLEQARQAVRDGADYIGCGPTFPSPTKHFQDFPGLDYLRAVQQDVPVPAFAIGGIAIDNVARVLETGVSRVAVGAAVVDADDPARAAREFLTRLKARA
jgi:thiamine-phosphate pyrophosphorylase